VNQVTYEVTEHRLSHPARVPLSPDEPKTLVEVFELVANRNKRPDTLNYKKDGAWVLLSSDEMISRMRNIAAGLVSLGVKPGDRVALLSESRVEWTLTDGGCIFARAVDVPIYPTLMAPQVRYILKDSGARILFLADAARHRLLADTFKECPEVECVVVFDAQGLHSDEWITLDELESRGRELLKTKPRLIDELSHSTSPDDLATLIYTSGTTGEPKGVMLTHSNLKPLFI
jgi:long-chain acyl-CoA synthetase